MPDLPRRSDPKLDERARILSAVPLFTGAPAQELVALAPCTRARAMRRGEILLHRGDPGSSMMIILAGQVRIGFTSLAGLDRVVRIFGPGDVFGEIALLDGGARSADAIALTNGNLLVLERQDFLIRMQNDPRLALRILRVLCQRLRSTTLQLEAMMFHDASTRLAATVLRDAEPHRHQRVDVTQSVLAEMVGAARETINKKLRDWERAGLVDLTPGRIIVRDRTALSALLAEAGASPAA
jgi:CRP-like cAMP-binding protein